MVRVARERIVDLFALAEKEAAGDRPALADRYVRLARRIGMRYNLRLQPEFRELYCRGCSTFWVEGRTVRTRLRRGHRVRTCLACGRERRTSWRRNPDRATAVGWGLGGAVPREDEVLSGPVSERAEQGERTENGTEEP